MPLLTEESFATYFRLYNARLLTFVRARALPAMIPFTSSYRWLKLSGRSQSKS